MLIELKNVTHVYEHERGTRVLKNVNLEIRENEFIGLIGHTGSGKSTLAQILNGLIKPSEGNVIIDGIDITKEKVNLQRIRQKIGLVFQYPEHQLFEETVYKDIAFGPGNLELDPEDIEIRVREALELVGLNYEEFKNRSPFNLSGGQQRKVAIAGVLAMKPEVLILDEPTAGLDPQGRRQLMGLLETLYKKEGITVILISHRMEEIARLSTRVIVLCEGKVQFDDSPEKVFAEVEAIKKLSLGLPEITEILHCIKERGFDVRTDIFTIDGAVKEIVSKLRRKDIC
ncbi:MAG: energy-coupling factor transporter ATPase [Halanaerobiaceae bacterium]|nr:energy-coupling factor transporter ATPase [Halanaerobiaceae bacterium]